LTTESEKPTRQKKSSSVRKGKKRARELEPETSSVKKRRLTDEERAAFKIRAERYTFREEPGEKTEKGDYSIHKKDVGVINDKIPMAQQLIQRGKWVLIWIETDPSKTFHKHTVWETEPYFNQHLKPILQNCGWTEKDLEIPAPSEKCRYSYGKNECTSVNLGHHNRHMLKHLPPQIGYFNLCPACKTVFRRTDMFTRHRKFCPFYGKGGKYPKCFKKAYQKNLFIRYHSFSSHEVELTI